MVLGGQEDTSSSGAVQPVEYTDGERRRFPRWPIRGSLSGWTGDGLRILVVDISMGGFLVEHPNLIRPGTIFLLSLPKLSVKCRVVRSGMYSQEAWPTGERNYVYRTGLELLGLSEISQRFMREYIDSLNTGMVG